MASPAIASTIAAPTYPIRTSPARTTKMVMIRAPSFLGTVSRPLSVTVTIER